MICQRCGQKEAAVQVNIVQNGVKSFEHICRDCYNDLTGSYLSFNMANSFQAVADLLGDLGVSRKEPTQQPTTCSRCGTTYRDFAKRGRFGCSHCYEAFKDKLPGIFNDIHSSHRYHGKIPQSPGLFQGEDKLALLIKEKEAAVAREDYERAAHLQKEIKALKKGAAK